LIGLVVQGGFDFECDHRARNTPIEKGKNQGKEPRESVSIRRAFLLPFEKR
jgi:hypothetical protein